MGLKSGSRDAGLDDGDDGNDGDGGEAAAEGGRADEDRSDRGGAADSADAPDGEPGEGAADAGEGEPAADTDATDARPTVESLPYTLRRETVNEGRSQVPFFLREEVIDGESDLQAALEASLGEEVYKSDYREAAMVLAQRNPDLVAAVLREWGYDLDPV
ncbi:hypothetical protein [Candidatus Halobonum tyrrellensis]|uniref:Uncharacterized protein n=1 Tax=Candidatus Halobonum tyrrellensis G22 TaxID=1324957 RepID=V4GNJ2_9EURY|nr:hypothetical protein [Candidatus Halobonum tyrrellensis]ESP86961.1 hypothetical protein K933_16912 [Candidatus Halobonum tyrrellensis G22]